MSKAETITLKVHHVARVAYDATNQVARITGEPDATPFDLLPEGNKAVFCDAVRNIVKRMQPPPDATDEQPAKKGKKAAATDETAPPAVSHGDKPQDGVFGAVVIALAPYLTTLDE